MRVRLIAALLVSLLAGAAGAQEFSYQPPGVLVAGSGEGRVDHDVYVPGMRFPIEASPAFANSQVWGRGGMNGGGGGQCHDDNFSYPWWDNFCESRQWDMPLCPSGTGHQGQDIRASTCEQDRWWAVAAEAGTITNIGSYSVYLQADSGVRHRYLHMEPSSVQVREGQRVNRGDRLGRVSDAFGDSSTTVHLHYDLNQNVDGVGQAYIPTYMSLVRSYEELIGTPALPCEVIPWDGLTLDEQGPCFDRFGPAQYWREFAGGFMGHLYWTYAFVADEPSCWARWRLHLESAGDYRVWVKIDPEYASAREAPYRVRAAGREYDIRLDYTLYDDWAPLGEFAFAEGGDQWIAVYDNSGEDRDLERRIVADAVRLERPPVAPPQDMFVPPQDMSVPPRDMFVPPPDAWIPPPDARPIQDARPQPAQDARPIQDARPQPAQDARPIQDARPQPTPDKGVVAPRPDAWVGADGGPQNKEASGSVSQTGGCAVRWDGGSALWLWGALALLAARRRRRHRASK